MHGLTKCENISVPCEGSPKVPVVKETYIVMWNHARRNNPYFGSQSKSFLSKLNAYFMASQKISHNNKTEGQQIVPTCISQEDRLILLPMCYLPLGYDITKNP